ncbi:MAG: preprotein translocase subunit SecG [Patescibacteria group bacterium]|nr:preprotein translocase subunit SecG [Patescibacteria group bacterium]MCL5261795.1 preprotein translocase subunit SecG [Patescibacteria group bacterium]
MRAITVAEIIAAVSIIGLILLQDRSGEGSSAIFGGSQTGGEFYSRRRGMEKILFIVTIAMVVLFLGLVIYQLALSNR